MQFAFTPTSEQIRSQRVKTLNLASVSISARATDEDETDNTGNHTKLQGIRNEDNEIVLYENRSDLKVLVSKISMHLKKEFREDIFKQIDRLLDLESFSEEDSLINQNSFASLLFFLSSFPTVKRPSLTVGSQGQMYCGWYNSEGRIHIEFIPRKKYRTIVSRGPNDNKEYFSHIGELGSLVRFLNDNDLMRWVINGEIPDNTG